MTSYLVRWEIDIDADNPEEAAEEALKIQRDTESWALVFDVKNQTKEVHSGKSKWMTIDLAICRRHYDKPEMRIS